MTEEHPMSEVDWRLVVRAVKESGTADGRARVKKTIREVAGVLLRLRGSRSRLFILTMSASEGLPAKATHRLGDSGQRGGRTAVTV